jgi:outer membrane protein insertion porin family
MVYFTYISICFCSVKDNLDELNIFKNIRVLIDVSRAENATPNGYEVKFYGKELPRIAGTIGTELGQNDGAATVELSSPNVLGRGERLSLNYSYSYLKATDLNLKIMKPFLHTQFGDYKPE